MQRYVRIVLATLFLSFGYPNVTAACNGYRGIVSNGNDDVFSSSNMADMAHATSSRPMTDPTTIPAPSDALTALIKIVFEGRLANKDFYTEKSLRPVIGRYSLVGKDKDNSSSIYIDKGIVIPDAVENCFSSGTMGWRNDIEPVMSERANNRGSRTPSGSLYLDLRRPNRVQGNIGGSSKCEYFTVDNVSEALGIKPDSITNNYQRGIIPSPHSVFPPAAPTDPFGSETIVYHINGLNRKTTIRLVTFADGEISLIGIQQIGL